MISVDLLKRNLDAYDMITIGNGMGRGEVTQAMVRAVLESDRPCLLDGDALYEAGKLIELLHRPAVTILTPHPKEMSYLCGCSCLQRLFSLCIQSCQNTAQHIPAAPLGKCMIAGRIHIHIVFPADDRMLIL